MLRIGWCNTVLCHRHDVLTSVIMKTVFFFEIINLCNSHQYLLKFAWTQELINEVLCSSYFLSIHPLDSKNKHCTPIDLGPNVYVGLDGSYNWSQSKQVCYSSEAVGLNYSKPLRYTAVALTLQDIDSCISSIFPVSDSSISIVFC